jgi:hypothetical protein
MAAMPGQLVLVIAIVAAGIVIAAIVSMRATKVQYRGNVAKGGAAGGVLRSPAAAAPTSPAAPSPANVARNGAPAALANPQPVRAPASKAASPPQGAPTEPHAQRPAALAVPNAPDAKPASKTIALGDTSELNFTLAGSATVPAPASKAAASPSESDAEDEPGTEAIFDPTATATLRAAVAAGISTADAPRVLSATEIFGKLFYVALGQARLSSNVSAAHEEVAAATAEALRDPATHQRYAPRRPNMLPKVLSASNDDSFSRRDLAALIARDPSLVGNLLKIANSSYYRVTPEPVESVDRAVVLLGTNGIRSLCTAALMQPIFRIGGADFPRFPEIAWEHTFRSASASVPYNFLVEKSDPFAAELLSLVMGLAGIVVFRVAMDQYVKNPKLRPDAGIISALLDIHSASTARRIGASWELSAPTLAGLQDQTVGNEIYPTALGRSLYFGRIVGALAVLRINRLIDDDTAKASIPKSKMPEEQVDRMWKRLTPKAEKR